MEQHPVPQNVTTFQFRLIGDMTIKQFGYLAGGAIGAYVFYKLPLPFFFAWPLTISSALLGIGLAFVPIEERPMDIWILSFFKNVYSPTQFVWQKQAAAKPRDEVTKKRGDEVARLRGHEEKQSDALASTLRHIDTSTPHAAPSFWSAIDNMFPAKKPGAPKPAQTPQQATAPTAPPVTFEMPPKVMAPQPAPTPASVFPNIPVPEVSGKHVEEESQETRDKRQGAELRGDEATKLPRSEEIQKTEEKERALETQVAGLQKELAGKNAADGRVLELQKQLTALIAEHDRMEKELVSLKRQADQPSAISQQTTVKPLVVATPATPPAPTISVMSADSALKAGLPRLTTYPNVVTGILKDNTKNLLPGVLVTVRDIEGIPLRALKTNRLGQFAASTPLPNGTYLVEVEDPRRRYVFDRVQITLNGSIVPVLEIIAKSERDLSRAQMAKDLFGAQVQ